MSVKERLADTLDVYKHPFLWGFIAVTTYMGIVIIVLDMLGFK